MSDATNPVIRRYLDRFESQLSSVPSAERGEMVREIENHIAEATHSGTALDAVLQALGPAERLADAYRVELALQKKSGLTGATRIFAILGILATTSLPTFIIVVVLGSSGLSFTLGGLAAMIAGPLSLIVPDSVIHFDAGPIPTPFAELSAVLVGAVLLFLGIGALALLYLFVRFLIRTVSSVVGDLREVGA